MALVKKRLMELLGRKKSIIADKSSQYSDIDVIHYVIQVDRAAHNHRLCVLLATF
jgi:hypothetical protein